MEQINTGSLDPSKLNLDSKEFLTPEQIPASPKINPFPSPSSTIPDLNPNEMSANVKERKAVLEGLQSPTAALKKEIMEEMAEEEWGEGRGGVLLGRHRGEGPRTGRCHRGDHRNRLLAARQPASHRGDAPDFHASPDRQPRRLEEHVEAQEDRDFGHVAPRRAGSRSQGWPEDEHCRERPREPLEEPARAAQSDHFQAQPAWLGGGGNHH